MLVRNRSGQNRNFSENTVSIKLLVCMHIHEIRLISVELPLENKVKLCSFKKNSTIKISIFPIKFKKTPLFSNVVCLIILKFS